MVVRKPTKEQWEEGPRIEPPVSVPKPIAPKLAATEAAVPPLEPAGVYSKLYGFNVVPWRELKELLGEKAHSAMLDLAIIMAPALTSFSIIKASVSGAKFWSEIAPAVVGKPLVLILSLTMIGIPWSGRSTLVLLYSSSSSLAIESASGLIVVIELICLSNWLMRSK